MLVILHGRFTISIEQEIELATLHTIFDVASPIFECYVSQAKTFGTTSN